MQRAVRCAAGGGRNLHPGDSAMRVRLGALVLAFVLSGCDVSMTQQPRYRTYAPSRLWSDGASARPLPDNTVAQGDLELARIDSTPPKADLALVRRGRERFEIF